MLKRSKFFHIFSDLGMGWHALDFRRLELTSDIKSAVEKIQSGIFDENELPDLGFLKKIGLLVEDGEDESRVDDLKKRLRESQIQGLYLIITTACNLNCSYCFYRSDNSKTLVKPGRYMDVGMVQRAIDFFVKLTLDNTKEKEYWEQITFYGGEPLLNLNTILAGVDYINKLKSRGEIWTDTHLVVNTNGTLITDEFAILVARKNIEVQISIDGFQGIHDKSRGRKEGGGSFEDVVKGMEILRRNRAIITPMITVTTYNAHELPSLVEWLYKNFHISQYFANLLISTTEEDAVGYPLTVAKAMVEAHRIARQLGIKDDLGNVIKGFSGPRCSTQSCGAGRKITIFPDGEIHTCQALEESGVAFLGQLPRFDQNSSNWKNWRERSRLNNAECLKCPIVGSCGGGCAAGSYNAHKDINSIDPNHCNWIKILFKEWISQR